MTPTLGTRSMGTRLAAATAGVAIIAVIANFGLSAYTQAQEEASGVELDPAVVKLALESRISKPAEQATTEERTAIMNELTDIYRVTELPRAIELGKSGPVKAQIELQRRAVLFNAFAMDFVASNAASEEEIVAMYDEQIGKSPPPKEFKARHILVESQSAAIELIKELQGGADFAELAKEKSTGPSGANGGDLGWFASQAMVKPFSDAVGLLEDGAFTSEPVQTQFGWHVILREDSRDGSAPPIDGVRDAIKNQVEQQKFQEFVQSLR